MVLILSIINESPYIVNSKVQVNEYQPSEATTITTTTVTATTATSLYNKTTISKNVIISRLKTSTHDYSARQNTTRTKTTNLRGNDSVPTPNHSPLVSSTSRIFTKNKGTRKNYTATTFNSSSSENSKFGTNTKTTPKRSDIPSPPSSTTKTPGNGINNNTTCQQPANCTSSYSYITCSPSNTDIYKYSRIVTLLLRDMVFTITLVTCNVLIYRSLKDPEHNKVLLNQASTRLDPNRTLKMLFANAIVFILLVLPKDIFTVVYTISHLTSGHQMDAELSLDINSALKLIQKCNSIVNIFIYAKLHTSFKETLGNALSQISLGRN